MRHLERRENIFRPHGPFFLLGEDLVGWADDMHLQIGFLQFATQRHVVAFRINERHVKVRNVQVGGDTSVQFVRGFFNHVIERGRDEPYASGHAGTEEGGEHRSIGQGAAGDRSMGGAAATATATATTAAGVGSDAGALRVALPMGRRRRRRNSASTSTTSVEHCCGHGIGCQCSS